MQITYNKGAILESAHTVITNAAGMADERDRVGQLTAALAEAFSGMNAATYNEHQHGFIQAFGHLIETVEHFGKTVQVVVGDASDIDMLLAKQV